jgi:TolC family type I secretion outer membrane protein
VLLLAMLAAGRPAGAETLSDAIALAYARNPALIGQRLTQRATDEGYVQARAQYGPTLSVQAQGFYERTRQPQATGLGTTEAQTSATNVGQAVATLSQPIYTSGRLRGQLLAARAAVTQGREVLRNTEQEVVQATIAAYAAVLRDEERLEVGRENVAVLQEQLRENRERYSRAGDGVGAGDVTLTDVGLSDSRLANAEITLASLEAQLAVSRAQYLQVVGQNPGTLQPIPELPGLPASVDEAFAAAEDNNPQLLASKYAEQAASANAAAARGALGPSVALVAQGNYTNRLFPYAGPLATRELVAGVSVTQPLFQGGALRSRVREADAQDGAAQAQLEVQRRATIEAVTEAWSMLASTRTALAAGLRQVTSAQLAYAGMHREELEGLRSTLDTLNAEQELVSAQLTLLQNRYEEYVAGAQLLVAVGALKAQALVDGLPVDDPAHYFDRVHNRGRTLFEPVARLVDRIGSANPRRPLAADLEGDGSPKPDVMPALPPRPGVAALRSRLVPVTQSRLVPAAELPGGLPPAPTLPPARPTGSAMPSFSSLGYRRWP